MVESVSSLSRNIDISFVNVREDIEKLKRRFGELNDSVDDLRIKNAELLSSFREVRGLVRGKVSFGSVPEIKRKVVSKSAESLGKLVFYDVKTKKKFESSDYRQIVKSKTLFAVTKSPYGDYECYRILKKV